ncbi:MAG: hypothetical protein AB7O21_16455 [Gammaproteobacteria bacterium]
MTSLLKAAFDITERQDHLHVELEPGFEMSLDAMSLLWCRVSTACERTGLTRILVEGEQPTREMRRLQVLAHGRMVAAMQPEGLRIAFCLVGYEPDFLTYFFTLVANGTTHLTRFFTDREVALAWLKRA